MKHFVTILMLTSAIFAFDDAYVKEVEKGIEKYNVESVAYNTSIQKEQTTKHGKVDVVKKKIRTTTNRKINVVNKRIKTPNDIKIFTSKKIKPINYTNTISLNKLEVSEKKQKFFHMILPAILISKAKLKLKRKRVLALRRTPKEQWSRSDKRFIEKLYKKYKTENINKLANRLKTHPVSIILAQAAIESAWGESRFFKKGNNIFGMWSYNRHEPRIKAKGTRKGKAIYVKKYASLSDAIDDYFVVIGRGAYKSFRRQRNITNNPLILVQYLSNYCEMGKKYTKKLRNFIVHNKLRRFDKFRIDEKYI
jgi:Bax protein